jgi:hypothetical protein
VPSGKDLLHIKHFTSIKKKKKVCPRRGIAMPVQDFAVEGQFF